MSDNDVNKIQQNVKELQDQNAIDFQQWKGLWQNIKKLSEKIKLSDINLNILMKKIKNDYENLKKIIVDENIQVQLNNKIDVNKKEINKKVNIETFENTVDEIKKHIGGFVNVKSFKCDDGKYVVGDGIHDDTTGIQKFINYVTTHKDKGIISPGKYKITNTLKIAACHGCEINGVGNGFQSCMIIQETNNIPIIEFITGDLQGFVLSGLCLDYKTTQPKENKKSIGILFSTMAYECTFKNLYFNKGYYAIYVKDDIVSFWGCDFDNIIFGTDLTGGAIRMTNLNAIPNNKFGRMLVYADNMQETIFILKGYNFKIDIIEILKANKGAKLFDFYSGTKVEIDSVKLEMFKYDNSSTSNSLFDIKNNCRVNIRSFFIGSGSAEHSIINKNLTIFGLGTGGGNSHLIIDNLDCSADFTSETDNFIFSSNSNNDYIECGNIDKNDKWLLGNFKTSIVLNNINVKKWNNNLFSGNYQDNNDITINVGDKCNYWWRGGTITDNITVNLPSKDVFGGLTYKFYFSNNVIPTGKSVTFKCDTFTIATFNGGLQGEHYIELTWRRNVSGIIYGWFISRKTF